MPAGIVDAAPTRYRHAALDRLGGQWASATPAERTRARTSDAHRATSRAGVERQRFRAITSWQSWLTLLAGTPNSTAARSGGDDPASLRIVCYATCCILLAKSRPDVAGGRGLPSLRYSAIASSTI